MPYNVKSEINKSKATVTYKEKAKKPKCLKFWMTPCVWRQGLMVTFWTEHTPKTVVVCTIDWSSTGIKQFVCFTHQHSEMRIDCQVRVTIFPKIFSWLQWKSVSNLNFRRNLDFKKYPENKYEWKFVKVSIKYRKNVLFLKNAGLWKIIPRFCVRQFSSRPARIIPGIWSPRQVRFGFNNNLHGIEKSQRQSIQKGSPGSHQKEHRIYQHLRRDKCQYAKQDKQKASQSMW